MGIHGPTLSLQSPGNLNQATSFLFTVQSCAKFSAKQSCLE
jgi:hypothetical protein